jgi:hypothetical protein
VDEVERQGMRVKGNCVVRVFGDFVFGVGRRVAAVARGSLKSEQGGGSGA